MYARDPDMMEPEASPSTPGGTLEEALTDLLRYFVPRVNGQLHIAEDLVQDTMVAAAANSPPPGTPMMAWLHGIARHKLVDYYRAEEQRRTRFGRRVEIEAIDIGPADSLPQLDLDAAQVQDDLVATLARLAPRQRAAMILRYFDECDVATVAALMDLSIHATESLLVRGRSAFRHAYREISGETR